MFAFPVVKCSDRNHKAECFLQATNAVLAARHSGWLRNGRKVTIRGEITDPCTCHLEALIYLAANGYGFSDDADGYQLADTHELAALAAAGLGNLRR